MRHCTRDYNRQWRKLNPERCKTWPSATHEERNKRARFYRERNKRIIDGFKRRPCMDCWDWFEPQQLQFDHRDPHTKTCEVSQMTSASLKTLIAEINKCDVVCASCHAARTMKQWKSGILVGRFIKKAPYKAKSLPLAA